MLLQTWILNRISLLLAVFLVSQAALANAQQSPQTASNLTNAARGTPVSLPHLYWHFLLYQNHLDSRAQEQEAKGHEGKSLKAHLQSGLGFSDTEFAPIRSSSARLAKEINVLNNKAAAIAAENGPMSSSQLQALTAEREADIKAEVSYLRNAMGPAKTATFEAFLVQMFSPKTISIQIPSPSSGLSPKGVQP